MKETNFSVPVEKKQIPDSYKKLVKNSFYSLLNTYGFFIFSLLSAFFIARLISTESWNFYIIALSYINIIVILSEFLPPSLKTALNYYIARFSSLGEQKELKNIIKHSIIIKLSFLIPIYVISLVVFYFFSSFFALNLTQENINLIFILSPLIIMNTLNFVLNSINMGLNRFKFVFFLMVLLKFLLVLLLTYRFFSPIRLESLEYHSC